jgi:hypothetical protein
MKKIIYIITILLSLLLGSCSQDPLTSEALSEDVSGKPVYEGLKNDGLPFSIIPLAEGNWWEYEVLQVESTLNDASGELSTRSSDKTYTLRCLDDYEQEGFRWFNMEVSQPISFVFDSHEFTNDIQGLSNRENGLFRKSSSQNYDVIGNETIESGLWIPYFEGNEAFIPHAVYQHTSLIVQSGVTYSRLPGDLGRGLIRYRYQTDLVKQYGLPLNIALFNIYDYYFKEGVGYVGFEFSSDIGLLLDYLPENTEFTAQSFTNHMSIRLIDYEVIEL